MYEKDKETIESCIAEFETLVSQSIEQYVRDAHRMIARYPDILDAEENGDYLKMTELLKTEDAKEFTLKKLTTNYRLYKVAVVAGMEKEALEHRAYVLKNSGDTFYKKELESVN